MHLHRRSNHSIRVILSRPHTLKIIICVIPVIYRKAVMLFLLNTDSIFNVTDNLNPYHTRLKVYGIYDIYYPFYLLDPWLFLNEFVMM